MVKRVRVRGKKSKKNMVRVRVKNMVKKVPSLPYPFHTSKEGLPRTTPFLPLPQKDTGETPFYPLYHTSI